MKFFLLEAFARLAKSQKTRHFRTENVNIYAICDHLSTKITQDFGFVAFVQRSLLISLVFSVTSWAEERTEFILPDETELLIQVFDSDKEKLLIWLPSEYGIRSGSIPFSYTVQDEGVDVWLVDLHESYMLQTGRKSYQEFDPQDIVKLIEYAIDKGWRKIFIGGESRAAGLALKSVRQWQLKHPNRDELKGLVFFHPHLIDGYTAIGDEAKYIKVANESNYPIYIFQPQYSSKYLRSKELIKHLERGGAQVFIHPLKGVNGGYHLRPDDDLSELDLEEKAKAGERVAKALTLLSMMKPPQYAAQSSKLIKKEIPKKRGYKLKPMMATEPPKLTIKDKNNQAFNLSSYKDHVVLINFWATWCGPCVEEIPSLMRLSNKMKDQPFKVVTINIGETPQHVVEFFKLLNIKPNFDVLFDTEGEAVNDWKIYAYPSNYLLDKNHKIRYAFRGALEWDDKNTVDTVLKLTQE